MEILFNNKLIQFHFTAIHGAPRTAPTEQRPSTIKHPQWPVACRLHILQQMESTKCVLVTVLILYLVFGMCARRDGPQCIVNHSQCKSAASKLLRVIVTAIAANSCGCRMNANANECARRYLVNGECVCVWCGQELHQKIVQFP